MLGILLCVPFIMIALSIPLILGKVPRNDCYGFRTPKTLSSDAIWYPANKIGGKYFVVAALVQLVALAVLRLAYPEQMAYGSVVVTVPILIAVVVWYMRCAKL